MVFVSSLTYSNVNPRERVHAACYVGARARARDTHMHIVYVCIEILTYIPAECKGLSKMLINLTMNNELIFIHKSTKKR